VHYRRRITPDQRSYPKYNIYRHRYLHCSSWWRTYLCTRYMHIIYIIVTTVDEDLSLILIAALAEFVSRRAPIYIYIPIFRVQVSRFSLAPPTHGSIIVGLRLQIAYLSFLRPFWIWRLQIPLHARRPYRETGCCTSREIGKYRPPGPFARTHSDARRAKLFINIYCPAASVCVRTSASGGGAAAVQRERERKSRDRLSPPSRYILLYT